MNDLTERVVGARTPADAKAIALYTWVMKYILYAKEDYCTQFKNTLIQSGETPLVECTGDLFCASGL